MDPKPPPADSRFIVIDDGNASPHFIRSTMYVLPTDRHVLRQVVGNTNTTTTNAMMGMVATPMALPSSDYPKLPYPPPPPPQQQCDNDDSVHNGNTVDANYYNYLPSSDELGQVPVDYTTPRDAPPRCPKCRAYVNPFFLLWSKCNFCGHHQNRTTIGTTIQYHTKGTVEYPVVGPYLTRSQPVEPHWIFCLDLTAPLILDYVDLILDDIWPTFYQSLVQTHAKTCAENGRKLVHPRVGMTFAGWRGIYIPSQQYHNDDTVSSCTGFVVMPDIQDDAFTPLPLSDWSWRLPDQYDILMEVWKTQIRSTLLPKLVQTNQADGGYSRSVGGAALAFLADALQETGGRAVWWTWRRPNYGLGALIDRERGIQPKNNHNYHNHPINQHQGSQAVTSQAAPSLYMSLQDAQQQKNSVLARDANLVAVTNFYTTLGQKCAQAKVALDIMLHTNPHHPPSFVDVATLGRLCESTSGRFIWMDKVPYESTAAWKHSIQQEVMRVLYGDGWDVIFKVRCSQGLSVRSIYSSVGNLLSASSLTDAFNNNNNNHHHHHQGEDELELSVVTPETAVGITLEHRVGGLPKNTDLAFVQTALLYTNPWTGDRRIRISTLALKVSSHPQHILPAIDFGTLAALQLRVLFPHGNYPSSSSSSSLSLSLLESTNGRTSISSPDQRGDDILSHARVSITETCVHALAAYRQLVSKQQQQYPLSMTDLLVPDSLQLWPLFVMSALKSPLLRPSRPRPGDGTRSMTPSPRGDERAYYFCCARKIMPAMALALVHPYIFDLGSSLTTNTTVSTASERIPTSLLFEWNNLRHPDKFLDSTIANLKSSPVVQFPTPLPATVSNLAEDGIYLLATCFALYVLMDVPSSSSSSRNVDADMLARKVHHAVTQLQLWSQVGREPKCLRPTASLPVVEIIHRPPHHDSAPYQGLLRWMLLDATSHEPDFNIFCRELNQKIQKISGGSG
jgi:hypothetical protein